MIEQYIKKVKHSAIAQHPLIPNQSPSRGIFPQPTLPSFIV